MSNLTGVVLSDYLLLECISRGSVADVYRARQNDGQYEVAVKVFCSGYAEREDFRAHFLQEAEKIGQFDHPHILPFIEYGEGEGLLYSVTPFVKSGTLDDLLKQVGGRFPAMQARPIVQQLCSAVQYAHERNVIHGNIQPRTIFVANDGRMLLADFGSARSYSAGQQAPNKMEWSSTQYAAPERSLGLLRRSSDIYSLGAVCFRLLTGSPVFVGQTPVEVLLKHVRQAPPSARSIEPNISDAVDEVLQKALSKRSDERYATAAEFSQAFTAAVAIAPVASPVARSLNLTTHPLTPDPQISLSAAAMSIAAQPTVPVIPAIRLQANQVSLLAPSSELIWQSVPEPSMLPEQHGLGSVSSTVPPVTPPMSQPLSEAASASIYWSHEPVEWSPLPQTPPGNGNMPLHAADYLDDQSLLAEIPAAEVEKVALKEQSRGQGRLLPILVLVLLLLGLLAALLSSFLLPPPTTHGAGLRVAPVVTFDLAGALQKDLGGLLWLNLPE